METKSMRRADRREHALRITVSRRRQWRFYNSHERHPESDTCYSKDGPYECGCRRRHHGNPKVGSGLCRHDSRCHVVRFRQSNRKLQRLVLTLKFEYDEDEVATVFSPSIHR